MEALLITFREGIEAALAIAIVAAFLRRDGHSHLLRWVAWGGAAGATFSIAAAALVSALGVSADSPLVEGVLFLVAAVTVVSMVVWMWRRGRNVHAEIGSQLGGIVSAERSGAGVAAGLFGLTFFMIAREGVEAVLLLAASAVGQSRDLTMLAGGAAGLLLAIAYGWLFARGSVKLDLRLFFTLTSIALGLLAVKLVFGAVHEFEEAGVLPMAESLAHLFDALAETPVIDWLFVAALAVPLLAPLLPKRGVQAAEAH